MAENRGSNGAAPPGVLGEDDLNEPLLPRHQQRISAVPQVSRSFWRQGVRGLWMSMCGYMYDESTGKWIDGGEPRPEGQAWRPQENPSLIPAVFYMYANSLMQLGSRKHLEQEDLWDVAPQHEATRLYEQYAAAMGETARPERFPHPFLLREFLKSIPSTEPHARLNSLFWGLLMCLCGVASTLLATQSSVRISQTRISMRQGLKQFLYSKSLVLSLQSKAKFGMGTLTNLLANDTPKIIAFLHYGHYLWSAPFQLVVAMVALKTIVGLVPTLCGLASVVIVAPLGTILGMLAQRVRKSLIAKTDARVQLITEVLSSIKAIKLYAWELVYRKRVEDARRAERRAIFNMQMLYLGMEILYTGIPIFIAMAVFGVYALKGGHLTADVAFPALAYLNMLHGPLMGLPRVIIAMVTARVSLRRLQDFVDADETSGVASTTTSDDPIKVEDSEETIAVMQGTFAWDKLPESAPTLSDITLSVPKGALCMVVGTVGSGKSSLLAAILGEMHRDPWIQNATVKENILMYSEYDEQRYNAVLMACALQPDLATLPNGDDTEIGEKGVTLSGGQKQRVALARACYAATDVVLLDDPLSAVDAHVQRTLMQEVIGGLLGKATRVLVTHQLQFLPDANIVVKMEQGRIVATGTYEELIEKGVELSEFKFSTEENSLAPVSEHVPSKEKSRKIEESTKKPAADPKKPEPAEKPANGQKGHQGGTPAEEMQRGQVKSALYMTYLRAWGPALVVPACFLFLSFSSNTLAASQDVWLSIWSRMERVTDNPSMRYYMTVYVALGMASIAVGFTRGIVLSLATLRASQVLHERLLDKVFSLPMSFFDTQPSGRLVSRFSKDVANTDLSLPGLFNGLAECIVGTLVATAVVAGSTNGVVLLAAVPMVPLYLSVQGHYLKTSRELNRLQSVTSSPILTNFSETLAGLMTVRAFGRQKDFSNTSIRLLDASTRTEWPKSICSLWLSIRLEIAGEAILFAAALFAALCTKNAALAGLALTSAEKMTGMLGYATSMGSQAEMGMNSVERMTEYMDYESEAPAILPDNRPDEGWPSRGVLEVRDVQVRYRPELPLVLKGLSFDVAAGEKVGICGRTGCGKSTLLLALYRIVELSGGSIVLDGIDIASIGLRDLRSNLSFVAQDPVLFSGTVRSNLDPLATCSDATLATALQQAGLEDWVSNLENGIDTELTESGNTLSVGQRQLLCMARALVKHSRILLMDEATSNVDNATDSLVQSTIRSAFAGCTVLTIAHRLHTIIDSDRILVLDAGELIESGSPDDLMKVSNGKLRALVNEASTSNAVM